MNCFVIMPFTDKYYNQYYDKIVKPAVEKMGHRVFRADEIYGTGPIIDDIFDSIRTSDFIIADVSGKNPNVNYELGAAHILDKKVIIITNDILDVPFDYRHFRIIQYDIKDLDWKEKLTSGLQENIRLIQNETNLKPVRTQTARPRKLYQATIVDIIQNDKGRHFKLDVLIPLDDPHIKEKKYVENETHWLSIWSNQACFKDLNIKAGGKVIFQIDKIYPVQSFNDTNAQAARDINPSVVVYDNMIFEKSRKSML